MKILLIIVVLSPGVTFSKPHQGFGHVKMRGEIVESACAIATDDVWQEIDFGNIPLRDISAGKRSSKAFYIHLLNCELGKKHGQFWKSTQITFAGMPDQGHPDLFAMKGEGTGVALAITDDTGNQAVSGEALPPVELTGKEMDLKYHLHLVNNGKPLSAGEVSSLVRFMVTYQ
ncbi:fimbrial protein [Siccibacter turicensis]|uniref:fimbrial protein n=1 Tax=Siccibacter turicensis TaxID=357233 RepID=UPI0004647AD0|nr:fimbrial protein [Siccibacter turicensis]